MTPRLTEEGTTLYRFLDAEGRLLYVGIAVDPWRRMKQHRGEKQWWTDIATMRLEQHATRSLALAAEERAIKDEHPRFNVVHNRDLVSRAPVPADVSSGELLSQIRDLDPAIDALVEAARLIGDRDKDTDYACACRYFYFARPSLRDLVCTLVGWERDSGPELLTTSDAYSAVLKAVYNSLPDCFDGCGVDAEVAPSTSATVIKAALMVSPYWEAHMRYVYDGLVRPHPQPQTFMAMAHVVGAQS